MERSHVQKLAESNSTHSRTFVVIIVVFLLAILGVYVYYQHNYENAKSPVNVGLENRSTTEDWLKYTNEKYGYRVSYPAKAALQELSSGLLEKADAGYIVNVTLDDFVISVYSNDKVDNDSFDLDSLVKSKAPLFVGKDSVFVEHNLNGKRVWKTYNYQTLDSSKVKTGATAVLVGDRYYYQVTTGNQYSAEFTSERNEVFDNFVSTFDFLD